MKITKNLLQDRTRGNQKFLSQYRLLTDFMDHIPDVIYFKDTKGRLILVNKAHAKGLGLTPEQVVGKTDFDIFPKERAQRMARDDHYVMTTGKSIIDKIERATRPDGVDNYVSTTKIPRYNEQGKIIGLIGITRDVTRRMRSDLLKEKRLRLEKKLEMLEDLNRIKSEFVSTVSHELRTPLAIVKQLLLLIFDETVGPINVRQRGILVKAQHNMERLKNIIDQLLDISRIEGKRLRLHCSLVNLNDLFKDSEDYFKALAAEKNISLSYKLPKDDVTIFIDAERIVQVISNLINNAIKFTEENGKVTIEVRVFENKIRVGVIDTGIGIAKEDLPKLFTKFTQVSRIEHAQKKGIGLGLSIVKELVEKHGGEVWAESQLGVGSKFYFTLPRYYTTKILDKRVKEKLKQLLERNVAVCVVNLVIVNYQEFKKHVRIVPQKFKKDMRGIIESSFKGIAPLGSEKYQLFITPLRMGKCVIVLPAATEKRTGAFCELLKDKTKNYFIQHKIEDVFVALGILSYVGKFRHRQAISNIDFKEIYVGSEMRRFKRVNYASTIEVIDSEDKKEICRTVDLSSGGVCFLSKKPYKTDTQMDIKFELIQKKKSILTSARVAWMKKMERLPTETADYYRIGVEFVNLHRNYRRILIEELKLML